MNSGIEFIVLGGAISSEQRLEEVRQIVHNDQVTLLSRTEEALEAMNP